MASVRFFSEEIKFRLPNSRNTASWIKNTVKSENKELGELNFIFCSDEYLRLINNQYLKHNTLTDIITFDHSELADIIEGDIYISVERVTENAIIFKSEFLQELNRVIIHGVLHLIGYSDKSAKDKSIMRRKEDAYLSLRGST
jgi:probable rRNA maturation factor